MLQPSKTKYRKQQKGRIRGISYKGSEIVFGEYGIKAVTPGLITSKQIESLRIIISKVLGKNGKMWIRIFPDKPVTRKAAGVRMGSGKGDLEFWAAVVRPGRVMFEVSGVDKNVMLGVCKDMSTKLSMRIKFTSTRELTNF